MAIWWVDPYKNAPIGGGNGTTSTGTSNGAGTYANPFSFGFFGKPACYDQWAANDEIRFKGLPESTFFPETSGSAGSAGLYSFDTITDYQDWHGSFYKPYDPDGCMAKYFESNNILANEGDPFHYGAAAQAAWGTELSLHARKFVL
jgi:hypothetical protein